MSEETKEVAKATENKPAINQDIAEPSIMMLAQNPDFPVEKLEMLIKMKNAEEDRQAKRAFDLHFAEMQAEFKPVVKDTDGSKTTVGTVAFKYAPIEKYQGINGPTIAKHKFSSKWTEEPLENGVLRVRIHISGWGHTDSETFTDVPAIATNNLMNATQARGAQKGYGRRITYVDGFGMTATGEDTDGNLSFDDGLKYGDLKLALDGCKTLEELQKQAQAFYTELKGKGDDAGIEVLRKLKIKRKGEVS